MDGWIVIIIIIIIIIVAIIVIIVILPFQRWTESPLPRTEPLSHGASPRQASPRHRVNRLGPPE